MHRRIIPGLLLAGALLSAASFAGAQNITNWVAYNDHVPSATTHPNANVYNLRGVAGTPPEPTEGFLKDFFTGLPTPAYLIVTATGAPDFFGSISYPNAGTPAYNLFNGIVDLGNNNSAIGIRASANTTVTLTFSNLNPSQRYFFRGTAVRGNSYVRRWTLVSLRGADSFTDAHTAGVYTKANFPTGTMTNGQAAYNSGENRADGALIGWDNIDPGADGVITIKNEQYADNPLPNGQTPDLSVYGYSFAGIYLAEVGAPTPVTITANPPANVNIAENRPFSLSGNAQGAPAPTFQWYKDNAPISGATARTFSVANAQTSDSGNYYLVANNSLNSATSTVAHISVVNDTNGPVLVSVKADDTFHTITVTWDELVAQGPAQELGNYFLIDSANNQIFVNTIDYLGTRAVLHVPGLTPGENYQLQMDYQQDLVGNVPNPQGTYIPIDPNGDPSHYVERNFQAFVINPGFTLFQAYTGLSAGDIAAFTASSIYPNGSSFSFYTNLLNWPQSAPNIEQYVMRFSGYYVATESGTHRFDPAHDDDMRLRVYDGEDTTGTFTELTAACCTGLTGGPTLDKDLTAGQRYYYELIVREYGGGDYAGIGVTMPSSATSVPIGPLNMAVAFDAANTVNAGIAQQPQNQSIQQNHVATFSLIVTNAGPSGAAFVWQRNTGGGFTDVTGTTVPSYTTPLQTLANNGDQYRVIVYTLGRAITSSVATLSVGNDTTAPHVTRVTGGQNLNTVTVFFDEVMNPATLGNTTKYQLTDSNNTVLALSAPVVAADNLSVTFSTPLQTLGASYTLHAQDVPDQAGNPLAPVNVTFKNGVGFVLFQAYDTSSTAGNTVALLTSHPNYPNNPRDTALIPTFDSRNVYPDDTHEQYGARISGWFVAPATTNYIFYNRSDDSSELWLSTDNTPANKVKIQEELGCCNGFALHPSAPKSLVAGNGYYMELLYKEGTGGDFGQVAFKFAGDPGDPNNLSPISGTYLTASDPGPGTGAQPRLAAARNADGTVTLSWSGSARLQCATSLNSPVNWQDINTGGATTYTVNPSNEFNVNLDVLQEANPPGARTGTGSGTVTLSNNVLKVNVSYSGLSAARSADHFHAPAARGVNAGVVYDLGSISTGTTSGTVIGDVPLVDNKYGGKNIAAQVQDIRSGLWYLNIHSTAFPGGEIRGQVDPGVRFYRLISP